MRSVTVQIILHMLIQLHYTSFCQKNLNFIFQCAPFGKNEQAALCVMSSLQFFFTLVGLQPSSNPQMCTPHWEAVCVFSSLLFLLCPDGGAGDSKCGRLCVQHVSVHAAALPWLHAGSHDRRRPPHGQGRSRKLLHRPRRPAVPVSGQLIKRIHPFA